MKIKLNKAALEWAKTRIKADEFETFDESWSELKPTLDELMHYLDSHDMDEYGLWFLAVDEDIPEEAKEHYVYPHGDLKEVQRAALLESQKEAEKKGHKEVAQAAKTLLDMIERA